VNPSNQVQPTIEALRDADKAHHSAGYIHPSSIVEPGAKIHASVKIGPFCTVGKHVELGPGCKLTSHVVIRGNTKVGENNVFYQFSTIGETPPDKKYGGERTRLEIGHNNVFRECMTVHLGTVQGDGLTSIGSNNLFLAYSHIAHDCKVGDHVIFANNATLAGHVNIGNRVSLGGFVKIAQFCTVGDFSYIGGDCGISKDIPAFLKIARAPERPAGLNSVGMARAGIDKADIALIKEAYRLVYMRRFTTQEALSALCELNKTNNRYLTQFIESIEVSQRGIIR
jgi:UDP-N-acetylglucosamine acyltransferase